MPSTLRKPPLHLLRICLRALVLPCVVVGLHACGGGGTGTDRGDEIESVTVTPRTAEIGVGGTVQLTAAVLNRRGESVGTSGVTWTSGNTVVATVDGSGLVTGRDAGAALITASVEGVSDQATVTVVFLPLVITTTSLPGAGVGQTYEESVLAEGGDGDYGWDLVGGQLPPGLSLANEDPVEGGATEAIISGTPDVEGSFTFTVQIVLMHVRALSSVG